MKICVPFKFWNSAMHCVAENDVRFYLNGIHISHGLIESTNGHIAYQAKFSHDVGLQNFDGEIDQVWPDTIIQPVGKAPSLSVKRRTCWLIIDRKGDSSKALITYVSHRLDVIDVQSAQIIDGKFPDFKKTFQKSKFKKSKDQFNIAFNARYLAMPQKILELEHSRYPGSVLLEAQGGTDYSRIEICRAASEAESEFLFLMPVRM